MGIKQHDFPHAKSAKSKQERARKIGHQHFDLLFFDARGNRAFR